MWNHNLKRHLSSKHANDYKVLQHGNTQHNANIEDEIRTETCKVEMLNELPVSDDAKLEFELQQDNEVYKKNVEIGEKISIILHRGIILENSLSKQNKFCLELFRAQKPTTDVENAELRLWQDQLLDIINLDEMEDRKIIWVIGKEGNEGKSWFQSYLQSLYGNHRVARFDITNKTTDLLHIMSRCALATTDIFLFNHQRCVPSEDCCYSLLEMIKDGHASAPKFHGSLLRFKKPNLIIVFSNRDPRIRSLSYDRWKICLITKDGLTLGHEEKMWQRQVDDCTVNKNKSSFRK